MSKSPFFRNLQVFRIPRNLGLTAAALEDKLATHRFTPCGSQEAQRTGFIPPRKEGNLALVINHQFLIAVCEQKKLLPKSVVNELAAERAKSIEDNEGRKVGRKEIRELRELVTSELMPQAMKTNRLVRAWIDPINGWLVVDSPSRGRAEAVLELLSKADAGFKVSLLKTHLSPTALMTDWLASGDAAPGFTIDQDCQMESPESASVRYARHSLEGEDVRRHLAEGKVPTRLAMTWDDRISFNLTSQFEFKRLSFLDILKETNDQADDEQERFDLDFTLMSGEVARLLNDLTEQLGGEVLEAEQVGA